MSSKYKPVRTMETIIDEKVDILRDFCVINNDEEEKQIRYDLSYAIRSEPYSNAGSVADRFTKTLISKKLK